MIVWVPILCVAVLAAVLAVLVLAPPALEQRRHARTLAHIAQLEQRLGIGGAGLARELDDAIGVAYRSTDQSEPARRVIGRCELCGARVALNAGRCRIAGVQRSRCAKELWRRAHGPA